MEETSLRRWEAKTRWPILVFGFTNALERVPWVSDPVLGTPGILHKVLGLLSPQATQPLGAYSLPQVRTLLQGEGGLTTFSVSPSLALQPGNLITAGLAPSWDIAAAPVSSLTHTQQGLGKEFLSSVSPRAGMGFEFSLR